MPNQQGTQKPTHQSDQGQQNQRSTGMNNPDQKQGGIEKEKAPGAKVDSFKVNE